jgi:stearoyl-CoA desaturase (Delta-9 desaturase)
MVSSPNRQREPEMTTLTQNKGQNTETAGRVRPPAGQLQRWVATITIFFPAIATAAAVALAITGSARPSALELGMTATLCLVTQLGITVGFHRFFTHRSFQTVALVRLLLGIAGSMAAQGPLLFWVSEHREHHQKSDSAGDPHSPYLSGATALHRLRGFWHAHVGWMLDHWSGAWQTNARDIFSERLSLRISQSYLLWVTAGILLPGLVAGIWYRSPKQAALGALWGGLVRIFLVHHATWSVNSIGHMIGPRAFATQDQSRNNGFVALISCGEGWHNNHHAFPSSARHGLERRQWDLSYSVIWLLARAGLAHSLKLPSASLVERSKNSKSFEVAS